MTNATPRSKLAAFHPASATDAKRAAYGIPPLPASNAELRQRWVDAFGGPAGVVAARLAPSLRLRSHPRMNSTVNGQGTAPNWSGAEVRPPSGNTISVAVSGVWNVPQVVSLGPGSGAQYVAVWIGVDGASEGQPLLQAGISATVLPASAPVYSAWAEWLSATVAVPPQEIANFSVNAGDSVEVQIWMTSSTTATAVMRKLNSNEATVIVPVGNPANAQILGLTAEWIVERPTLGFLSDGQPILATLADYSPPVVFTQARAWAQAGSDGSLSLNAYANRHGVPLPASALGMAAVVGLPQPVSLRALLEETVTVDAGSGSTITMTATDGSALSTASVLGGESIQCGYVGPQAS